MGKQELATIVKALLAPGEGLLATDESTPACNKRFQAVGIAPTKEDRRDYRKLILTTSGLGTFISGANLYDETIRPTTKDGTSFDKVMTNAGIIPGIKVDREECNSTARQVKYSDKMEQIGQALVGSEGSHLHVISQDQGELCIHPHLHQ